MPASRDVLAVEVTRGPLVESRHAVSAWVADATGAMVAGWGDGARPTFPRSSLKPVQALPLAETGAMENFGLEAEHLALACASHSGERMHTERVAAWLARLSLSPADLECGAHLPADPAAARALAQAGKAASPLHNNCSGKHAGFLSVARHLGLPTRGYVRPDHAIQKLVARVVSDVTGLPAEAIPAGTDGCGIPAPALPLSAIATAMARLADPVELPPVRARAARAITSAMAAHPLLVAGTGRLCSVFMAVVPRIVVKGGAEGVYTAILPDKGWGIALKAEDGARRAAEVGILAVLRHLGLLSEEEQAALADRLAMPITNVAGTVVGMVRAVD